MQQIETTDIKKSEKQTFENTYNSSPSSPHWRY